MSNDISGDSIITLPPGADDLARIRGISHKIAGRLYEAGILTFAKLAAMSPDEIVARIGASAGVTPETIISRDWIGQARAMVAQPASAAPQAATSTSETGLSEVSYVVGLLVDERKQVQRTKILDVNNNQEAAWDGWDDKRLTGYFAKRSELRLPRAKPASTAAEPAPLQTATPESICVAGREPADTGTARTAISIASRGALAGVPRVRTIEVMAVGAKLPGWQFGCDQRFNVRLALDLSDVTVLSDGPFNYTAIVQAKSLGGGQHQTVGEASGEIRLANSVTLHMGGNSMPAGVYRLLATVKLGPRDAEGTSRQHLMAQREGGVLQVL